MALCFIQRRIRVTTAYRHRGLWEMTPKTLLLFLVLTACLSSQVQSGSEDISGAGETELHNSEELSLTSGYTPAQMVLNDNTENTAASTWTTAESQVNKYTRTKDTGSDVAEQEEPDPNPTTEQNPDDADGQDGPVDSGIFLVIIAVAMSLALFLIGLVVTVVVFVCRRRKESNSGGHVMEDPCLDGVGEEKVPMPMFEDDVPSVMELEMEDLEKWMIKGDGGISTDTKQMQFS